MGQHTWFYNYFPRSEEQAIEFALQYLNKELDSLDRINNLEIQKYLLNSLQDLNFYQELQNSTISNEISWNLLLREYIMNRDLDAKFNPD